MLSNPDVYTSRHGYVKARTATLRKLTRAYARVEVQESRGDDLEHQEIAVARAGMYQTIGILLNRIDEILDEIDQHVTANQS